MIPNPSFVVWICVHSGDDVADSFQACPPGEAPCPDFRNCYLQCSEAQAGTWVEAPGAAWGPLNMAYCERFPSALSAPSDPEPEPVYLANVGPPYRPRFHFDTFFSSFVTAFMILAQDGWSTVMHDAMRAGDQPGSYAVRRGGGTVDTDQVNPAHFSLCRDQT
jgi:hypothetical protein